MNFIKKFDNKLFHYSPFKVIRLSVTITALALFIEVVDKELVKYELENSR